ncbi:MAG: hypothetical protein AAGB48_01575 [Planctomycetota bacterium]
MLGIVPGGVLATYGPDSMLWELFIAVGSACSLVLVLIALAMMVLMAWLRGDRVVPGRIVSVVVVLAFVAGVLSARYRVPQRAVFTVFKPGLVAIADGRVSAERIGPFPIRSVARDHAGGVYIQTSEEPDMIDTTFYGFARDPEPETSPFGRADYQLEPLGGGWYVFRANDDYF